MKLLLSVPRLYKLKRGQTLRAVAEAFGIPPRLIAAVNSLTGEPEEGTVLSLPAAGDLYTVRGGETRALLCGSDERFEARNRTRCLYPGQTVLLG